jgi:S1-C subfamily serine protease
MFQTRGWSGIEEKSHNDDWTRTIRSIIPGSPADRVGLKAGDVIVSINGLTLSEVNEPRVRTLYAKGLKIGERLSIGILRGDEISTIKVLLERIPDAVLTARIERHGKEQHRIARN